MFGTAYKDSKGQDIKYNPGSIFGQIKTNISDGFGWMRKYLFGEPKKGKDGKPQSFMDQMYDTLGTGWTNFKNFFFGGSMDAKAGKQEFTEIMTDFKKHMPKAMAYGVIGAGVATFTNFGILGSLFLPGGPIGGALLGTAAGLLGQSEKFKNFLFGPKGADDKRIGDVISKSVQDFFSKHKTAIIGAVVVDGWFRALS